MGDRPQGAGTWISSAALALLASLAFTACLEPNPAFVALDGAPGFDGVEDRDGPSKDLHGIEAGCTEPCTSPPAPCFASPGQCDPETGQCSYTLLPSGSSCPMVGACATSGTCDAQGRCVAGPCRVPHATEGRCVDGVCEGFSCTESRGDCNDSWQDGCEAQLTTDPSHCGGCDQPCPSDAPNAQARCNKGQCTLTCRLPFADCNEDPSDGCEIPVGEPNRCDRQGLTTFDSSAGATPGCGTAYCGAGGYGDARFGSWFCTFCDHCKIFADGGAWCITQTGRFAADRCQSCCNPDSPIFPQVCVP